MFFGLYIIRKMIKLLLICFLIVFLLIVFSVFFFFMIIFLGEMMCNFDKGFIGGDG